MAESAANSKVSSCLACCTHTWLLLGATEAVHPGQHTSGISCSVFVVWVCCGYY